MLDSEFERIGKRLFLEGLVGGNFGNISIRADRGLYITHTFRTATTNPNERQGSIGASVLKKT